MNITIECTDDEDIDWNNRLINSKFGTIYQTKEMSINFRNQGFTPKFLKFFNEKGDIVGQLLYSEVSRFAKKNMSGLILKHVLKSKILCQWSNGPIILDEKYINAIYGKLGKFLHDKNYGVSGTEHPFSPGMINDIESKIRFIPWSTFIINLQQPKDLIYNNIEKHIQLKLNCECN